MSDFWIAKLDSNGTVLWYDVVGEEGNSDTSTGYVNGNVGFDEVSLQENGDIFIELSFEQTNLTLGDIVVDHPYPNVLESSGRRIGATALVSISADGMWQSGMAYSEGMTNVYSSNDYLIDDNGDILWWGYGSSNITIGDTEIELATQCNASSNYTIVTTFGLLN